MSKSKGEDAFKRKDYLDAIHWYTEVGMLSHFLEALILYFEGFFSN